MDFIFRCRTGVVRRVGTAMYPYHHNTVLPFQFNVSPYHTFPMSSNFAPMSYDHNTQNHEQSLSYHFTGKQSHAYSTYKAVS